MKKTGMIMRINMRKVERMTQRKRMSLTKVWKMLMVWKLFKRLLQVVTAKSVKLTLKTRKVQKTFNRRP